MRGRPRIDFEEVKLDVVVLLHGRFLADLRGLSPKQIASECKWPYNFVRMVLQDIKSNGLCREDYDGPKEDALPALGAAITGAYIRYIPPGERVIEIARGGIDLVNKLDDDAYIESLGRVGKYTSDFAIIPASDRTVTLNHNQSDYQQAVESLDKVLEEFRNDHRLDNELGPQKEAYLKVLEGGRKALEDKEISAENGQNWIVKPLKWIAERYADGTLKAMATEALKWVLSLFEPGN